jgi:hypothetical protein
LICELFEKNAADDGDNDGRQGSGDQDANDLDGCLGTSSAIQGAGAKPVLEAMNKRPMAIIPASQIVHVPASAQSTFIAIPSVDALGFIART